MGQKGNCGGWYCYWAVLWILGFSGSCSLAFNITTILQGYPEFQRCNDLLTTTNVAKDINNRTSLTILVLSNAVLDNFIAGFGQHLPYLEMQYVMQYHVLLEYLDPRRLSQMATDKGNLVTTLYQTTGRASKNFGSVNVSEQKDGKVTVSALDPYGPKATITALLKAIPYSISIFSIDNLLLPSGFDLSASTESDQVAVNVTEQLVVGKNFNVFLTMLSASDILSELESHEAGAGITVFAPTDDAFSELPSDTFQSLAADNKAAVLRYHVLTSYYPLGSLQSIYNPVQPTLATEKTGAGRYTLNITRINGSLVVDTGIVHASITQTVCDQKPLVIFGVSKVLLPRELFGKQPPKNESPSSPPVRPPPTSHVVVPSPSPTSSTPSLPIPPSPPNQVPTPPSSFPMPPTSDSSTFPPFASSPFGDPPIPEGLKSSMALKIVPSYFVLFPIFFL